MSVNVVYVSDQGFFRCGRDWYTTASFPLAFISEHLDIASWTFWGRLYDIDDPARLHPVVPPRLMNRVRFSGPHGQPPGPAGYAWALGHCLRELARVVSSADVVWLKQPMVFALLARPFCRSGQVIVSHQVGDAVAGLAMTYPRYRIVGSVMSRLCKRVNATADVTAFVSEHLARHYGQGRPDRIVANESRITEDMIASAPVVGDDAPLRVVYVGRLAPEKCVDDALRAIALVPGSRLTLVGDGPERPRLEALSAVLGLSDRVAWRGYVPWGPRLLMELRESSVLVLPSATEGLPLVLVEAMSQGLPVVATRVGGIPEVIEDGVSGLLVDVHRPDQLAEALRALARAPDLRCRMGVAAIQTAHRNTLRTQLLPLLQRIAEVTHRKGPLQAGQRASV